MTSPTDSVEGLTKDECKDSDSVEFDIPLKLDEAQKAISDLKLTIEEEASLVRAERAELEFMRKKLDSVHFKKHIKLNVGGIIFKTSLDTLRKDSNSLLASMFSGSFDVRPDKEDGAYFIDRDGTHFRYILNYLRTGRLVFPKENNVLAAELFFEAEYYKITGMPEQIWPGPTFENPAHIFNSLTVDQREALLSWLPTPNFSNWAQLFVQNVNGWSPANFHNLCDKKGPTLVLAKATNFVLGGYTQSSWNSNDIFVPDETSFLFTLVNKTGAVPTKLPQFGGGGTWCNKACGPCFGSESGVTITFMNNANGAACVINNTFGGFECPTGQDFASFILGTTTVNMTHLQVFGPKAAY